MVEEVTIYYNRYLGTIVKPSYLSFLEVSNTFKLGIKYVEFTGIFIYENNLL